MLAGGAFSSWGQRVHFAVYVFDGNLEAVETSGFWRCDFGCEVAVEIFVDDAIRSCKEGEDMHDKVLFQRRESVPIDSVA